MLKFVFLSMDMQLFQQYSVVFVEKTTIYKFFIALPVYLHKKLPQPYLWLSIYGLYVLFHWFICLHFNIRQHFSYCGLIISLKMGQSESFDFIFSFFCDCFVYFSSFDFPSSYSYNSATSDFSYDLRTRTNRTVYETTQLLPCYNGIVPIFTNCLRQLGL